MHILCPRNPALRYRLNRNMYKCIRRHHLEYSYLQYSYQLPHWTLLKCPIVRMCLAWYMYTMKCYSALQRNVLSSHDKKWKKKKKKPVYQVEEVNLTVLYAVYSQLWQGIPILKKSKQLSQVKGQWLSGLRKSKG